MLWGEDIDGSGYIQKAVASVLLDFPEAELDKLSMGRKMIFKGFPNRKSYEKHLNDYQGAHRQLFRRGPTLYQTKTKRWIAGNAGKLEEQGWISLSIPRDYPVGTEICMSSNSAENLWITGTVEDYSRIKEQTYLVCRTGVGHEFRIDLSGISEEEPGPRPVPKRKPVPQTPAQLLELFPEELRQPHRPKRYERG